MLPKNPKQIEEILKPLQLSSETYGAIKQKMDDDMTNGLSTDQHTLADAKMYITYVRLFLMAQKLGTF
ncbi:hypothetical protein EB796_017187 [Bugula neritina]|uniref:Hexokinase N-terminal domain-containing protein n=1 Tax=Bugula neritina TaxID=10212 RepID=A0A7J7JEG0_BUGNE|nr:hypothetical protein EB796_017187 [Bugula neritina]